MTMAKLEDLPIDIVDIIFAYIRDVPRLHAFLLSKQTHRSAKIAIYKHINIRVPNLERLRFAISYSKMFLDAPKIASLEPRGPLLKRSTPAWNMSNIDFATLTINGLLRQASEITSLTLLVMPMAFSPNINALTRLEDLTIWQSYISLGPRTLTIDASQAENLQSLSVCTLSLCIMGPIISTSLKHLTLACGTAISYAGNDYDLRRRSRPALSFTQLQTVTVMVSKALSTARWLEALAHQLSAAKNTLRLLWVYSACGYTANSRDRISFQAYTALQKIRFSLAAFTPHESGTLYSHKFKIHLVAPTVTEIDLYVKSTPISAHTLRTEY
jgi:hypothetical protein